MRNRIILFALIFLIWGFLKAVDYFFNGPQLLFLLSIAVAIMLTHTLWLLSAQKHWQRKVVKHKLTGHEQIKPRNNKFKRADSQDNTKWNPWVDIFIAAKNEGKVIENTIRSLFELDYDKFLLWIIDDCSIDDTQAVLQRLTTEFPNLRIVSRIPGSHSGKSAALNDALALAKGDVVAVFDADAYVEPDFLKIILPVLAPEGIGAVQAQKKIYDYQKGWLIDCQSSEYALDTYFQVGRDIIGGAVELRGNGQLIKRSALIDVGGWNNNAITDDLDLSMRLLTNHWDIRFCPYTCVYEEGVTTVEALLKQRKRLAEGSVRRYLDYIFPLNSPTRLSFAERFDTLAFTVLFVVPAIVLFEIAVEILHYCLGLSTHANFLAALIVTIFIISQLNLFIAVRVYGKPMSVLASFSHSLTLGTYLYLHWLPCVFSALKQIIFGKKVSQWHPTEHIGHPGNRPIDPINKKANSYSDQICDVSNLNIANR
jgi:1,2-diacylglycerol 3-beta-glucosyltransferase